MLKKKYEIVAVSYAFGDIRQVDTYRTKWRADRYANRLNVTLKQYSPEFEPEWQWYYEVREL